MSTSVLALFPGDQKYTWLFILGFSLLANLQCQSSQNQGEDQNKGLKSATEMVQLGPGHFAKEAALMGTRFYIQIDLGAHPSTREVEKGKEAIEAALSEVDRIEQLISEWIDTSEISAVNRAAGLEPVKVGPELLSIALRGKEISKMTGGAFDMTFASCGHLWSISKRKIPSDAEIQACLPKLDWKGVKIDVSHSTVYLTHKGAEMGTGGIGKGYGVDAAARILEAHGIQNYIVDGGGDLRVKGKKSRGPWMIGIANPRGARGELWGAFPMDHGAVVSSGDYERYFIKDGVRYHHIIDPRTGKPARKSVALTVIAPTAMDADALSTGLFVLGPEQGMKLVESLPHVEALFFGPDLKVTQSSGFPHIQK